MHATFTAPRGLGGAIVPPPDKSLTHRALMLAAVAEGTSSITNPLRTGDCLSTASCLERLGVGIESAGTGGSTGLKIRGVGLRGFCEPEDILDAENSGTTIRLLSGLLAGLPIYAVLTGDASLRRRPMLRVVAPLRELGASIHGRQGGALAPLAFLPGSGRLFPGALRVEVASAQLKSALLLAGLRVEGELTLSGELRSRDHTERFFRFLGVPLEVRDEEIVMSGQERLPSFEAAIPGDPSSASFFVAAALLGGRDIEVRGCGVNPTRLGLFRVLERMGARVRVTEAAQSCGEPVGTIAVSAGELVATGVEAAEIPDLIDEVPLLALLASQARGVTEIRGAEELRHKESDRIAGICALLSALGGRAEPLPDGLRVRGPQHLGPGRVDPAGDHRIAMTAAVAAVVAGSVTVSDVEATTVSYPDFLADYRSLGGEIREEAGHV